jgi:hypothetical protein
MPRPSISKLEFVDDSPTGIRSHGTASKDNVASLEDSRIWTTRVDELTVVSSLFSDQEFGNLCTGFKSESKLVGVANNCARR